MNFLRLAGTKLQIRRTPLPDGALLAFERGNKVVDTLRLGPNEVHAMITHADGSVTDLGVGHNLLTTVGRDLIASAMGDDGVDGEATSGSATTLVDSGSGWTVDAYKGWKAVFEDAGADVYYGNVGSNTSDTLTVDDWLDPDDTTATVSPASGDAFGIFPACSPRYMGITADASAASAGSTTLTSEETTNGMARTKCAYAHTGGAATFTLVANWSATGTVADLHRIGLFTAADVTAGGVIVFESVLDTDASVVNGDTLQVTDTVTLS